MSALVIELGDIIQIESPSNDDLHNKIFLVKYIDLTQLHVIDNKSLATHIINVSDGILTDESIKSISILYKHPEKGYARQNNLFKDIWVTIEFGGDVPALITAQITNLEEDMIELKTFPEGEVIYIDFGYKGIPLDIPIKLIKIRAEPAEFAAKITEPTATVEEDEESAGLEDEDVVINEELVGVSTKEVRTKLREVIKDADNIVFGEDLGEVDEIVDVVEKQRRYGIDTQVNDLMDEMLSTIPNVERTRTVLNRIHILLERFKQLRDQFSKFDDLGNANRKARTDENNRPATQILERLSHNLHWIMPIVKNIKKVYDVAIDDEDNISQKQLHNELVDEQKTINNRDMEYDKQVSQLSKFRTPFETGIPNDDVLGNVEVGVDLDVIVSTLENISSTVISRDIARSRRFVIGRYNLGINRLKTALNKDVEIEQITKSDAAHITGFAVMPKPFVRFSGVKLPGVNIYNKANFSQAKLNYWYVLNESVKPSVLTTYTLTDDDDEFTEHYFKNLFIYNTAGDRIKNEDDKYRKFLNKVIPKTRFLFNLLSKYITGSVSYVSVIEQLEPFAIYQDNITFKQYEDIVNFVRNNIVEFRKKYEKNKVDYLKMRKTMAEQNIYNYKSIATLLFNNDEVRQFYAAYYNPEQFNSNEYISRTTEFDYGKALHLMIAKTSVQNLVGFDADLTTRINQQIIERDDEPDACSAFVLSKKYIDHQELEDDNGVDVYFDKQYDETRYNLRKDEYTDLPRKDAIIRIMREHHDVTEREAIAIYDGKRLVIDGDWAVLDADIPAYYERRGGRWEHDPLKFKDVTTTKQSEFCELNPELNCYQDGPDCKDETTLAAELNNRIMNNMIKVAEMDYDRNLDEFKKKIESDINHYFYYNNPLKETTRYSKLYAIHYFNKIKTNIMKSTIGDSLEERNIIQSPWTKLLHVILGQSDFIKKQHDIIRFANNYTKEDKLNPYMLYCKDTDVPLLPTFMVELANAATGMSSMTYEKVLDRICKEERATLSDSGDAYVDKYSGYVIKHIEFSTDEGYEDTGYKYVSREILEQDLSEVLTTAASTHSYVDEKARMIYNVFKAITDQMNVILDSERDFVVSSALDSINKKLPSRGDHEKKVEEMKAKGKKYPSYDEYMHSILMYYTLAYTLIAIQAAVPSVRSKKTFPGCVRSFKGYPVYDELDMGAITYIACIANAIKSSSAPWNVLKGKSSTVDTLIKQIRTALDDIIKNSAVKLKIQAKKDYLAERPDDLDEIPAELRISKWTTFLPPLGRIELENASIKPLTAEFRSSLIDDVNSGNPTQVEKINLLLSKLFYYSLAIQQNIQNTIDKEELVLKTNGGVPFMENVCCNDGTVNTFNFFDEQTEGELVKYSKMAVEIKKIYDDYMKMIKPVYYIGQGDTKLKYPAINADIGEDAIYSAFIHYCKFNRNVPLSEDMMGVCLSNKSTFKQTDTLKSKIDTLKKEGRNFTVENLYSLLNIINRQNLVKLELTRDAVTQKQRLSNVLESIMSAETANKPLIKLLTDLLDSFEVLIRKDKDETITDDLFNFLFTQTSSMKADITAFVKRYAVGDDANKVAKYLAGITSWHTISNRITLNDVDETNFRIIRHIQQNVVRLCCEFPSLVLNKVTYESLTIPSHWELSSKHISELYDKIMDITNKMATNFVNIEEDEADDIATETSVANERLIGVLRSIRDRTKYIHMLMKTTPFYAAINDTTKPIVGSDLIVKLHEYFLISMINEYMIAVVNDKNTLLKEKMAKLLVSYVDILSASKTMMNVSKNGVMDSVLRSKEVEKKEITDYLGALSTEKRKVENLFKSSKLGDKWSIGLTSAVYKYDPKVYDMEMEAAAKRAEADELNMGAMPNDDEVAEGMDGDEGT